MARVRCGGHYPPHHRGTTDVPVVDQGEVLPAQAPQVWRPESKVGWVSILFVCRLGGGRRGGEEDEVGG